VDAWLRLDHLCIFIYFRLGFMGVVDLLGAEELDKLRRAGMQRSGWKLCKSAWIWPKAPKPKAQIDQTWAVDRWIITKVHQFGFTLAALAAGEKGLWEMPNAVGLLLLAAFERGSQWRWALLFAEGSTEGVGK
jgi:hypothetical protein